MKYSKCGSCLREILALIFLGAMASLLTFAGHSRESQPDHVSIIDESGVQLQSVFQGLSVSPQQREQYQHLKAGWLRNRDRRSGCCSTGCDPKMPQASYPGSEDPAQSKDFRQWFDSLRKMISDLVPAQVVHADDPPCTPPDFCDSHSGAGSCPDPNCPSSLCWGGSYGYTCCEYSTPCLCYDSRTVFCP